MIYHITYPDLWEEALEKGEYSPPSLKTEGFIHCSKAEQLPTVAEKHFAGEKDLVLLHIVERRLGKLLRMEQNKDNDVYPHIYGAIPLTAVEDVTVTDAEQLMEW